MRRKSYERSLPGGYKLAKKMDAKDVKFGLLLTLGSLLLFAVALVPCAVPMFFVPREALTGLMEQMNIMLIGYFGGTLIYLVLHELVHGIAYKSLTGEKLTFGLSWSCAFCGVPNIYTYRKTSIIASAAPLVVFSVVFCALCAVLFYVNIWYFYAAAFILGMHLGGCSGDIYMLILMAKFKNPKLLVRDTGPAQTFYMPEE